MSSILFSRLAAPYTVCPSFKSFMAVLLPMPEDAPVIKMTFFESFFIANSSPENDEYLPKNL
jgi:hypothetical protein